MPRKLTLLICAALALAVISEGTLAQTRGRGTIGYSAAERRVVDERITSLTSQIERLSSQRVMSPRLVRAIATEVGLANPRFSDAELLGAVEAMSEQAMELRGENQRMRREIERLRDPALRDPALALLTRAELAIDEGRLVDAEALYNELRGLHWDESREADEAWEAAVSAEARTAELQQNFVRAQDLRLAASDLLLARSEQSRLRAYLFVSVAAAARTREGQYFGRLEALDAAIELWRQRVLPLVSPDQNLEGWRDAQYGLGITLLRRAEQSEGDDASAFHDQAVIALQNSIGELAVGVPIGNTGRAYNAIGVSLQVRGKNIVGDEGTALLRQSRTEFQSALIFSPREEAPEDWAATQINLGSTLGYLAERFGGEDFIVYNNQAIAAYNAALEVATREAMPETWANAQNNLANSLVSQGDSAQGPARRESYQAAERAYLLALEIWTAEAMPALHLIAAENLAVVRASLAASE